MRRQDISGRCIAVVQKKIGTVLSIPIHPTLAAIMKAGPHESMNLIGGSDGRQMTNDALSATRKRAVAAGLPPECAPHGLRKAMAFRLAVAGASTKQIASISGHKALTEIERYTAAADQKHLSRAAMDTLRTYDMDDGGDRTRWLIRATRQPHSSPAASLSASRPPRNSPAPTTVRTRPSGPANRSSAWRTRPCRGCGP
jgi:hypothetical protein